MSMQSKSIARTAPSTSRWRAYAAALAVTLLTVLASPARAQDITTDGVPDDVVLARLAWTSMVTLDNANRTGNYDVLWALSTPQFQELNSPDSLAQTFAGLRENRVDVGRALLVTPTWYEEPAVYDGAVLRLRGAFEFRPRSLRFDLVFLPMDGGWRLHGISVADMRSDAPR